jgi:oxygen-independent coproporphyrinogen-3 oxidase
VIGIAPPASLAAPGLPAAPPSDPPGFAAKELAAGTLPDGRVVWEPAVRHLYVHVPFCAHKCEYCAFFSEVPSGDLMARYVAALARELALVAPDLRPRTIYFGGGTPSLLPLKHWEALLRQMERLNLLGADEFTVECNPATVSADKARLLRDFGVNRLSLGVQSLDEALLDRLGRVHSRAQVFDSFDCLRQAGFANLNLDLMFAIPGQSLELWQRTLTDALALGSEHLSCYEVIYEEDTPLYAQLGAGQFSVDEDLACAQYERLVDTATRAGYHPYEVANFARSTPPATADRELPAFACRHNVNYWRGGSFYGLGPSATSYVRGERTRNWANTPLYCGQLERDRRAFESRETLSPLARAAETAAFGLRLNLGWPYTDFTAVTGFDLRAEWAADLDWLEAQGWGERQPDRFRLTRRGLRFADLAAERLLRPDR